MDDFRSGTGEVQNQLRESEHANLFRVPEIDGPSDVLRAAHQFNQPTDQIVDITERSRLQALAEHADVAIAKSLQDETRDHAPIVGLCSGSIGIEDAGDLDRQSMLSPIVKK